MKPTTKRLLGSLLLPPTLGAGVLFVLEEVIDGWWRGHRLDHAGLLLGYLVGGVAGCLIPGLLFWGVFELIWRKHPTLVANRMAYAAVGALLGLIFGLTFALIMGMGRLEGAFLLQFLAPGAAVGFATAWFCRGANRTE